MHLPGERFAGVRVVLSDSVLTARAGVVAVAQLLKRHAQLPQSQDSHQITVWWLFQSSAAGPKPLLTAIQVYAFDGGPGLCCGL